MSKYTKSFKLKVVKSYLSGDLGMRRVAQTYAIARSQVREWVSAYHHHGVCGLERATSARHYSVEYKLSVLAYRHQHQCSLLATARHFNIPSPSTLLVWEKRYNEAGSTSLIDHRKRTRMKKTTPNPYVTGKQIEALSPDELKLELQYLRTENAYLKKLDALIQSKKLQQKTKQK